MSINIQAPNYPMEHMENLGTAFQRMLEKRQFVDATLVCEGLQIHCHRMILAASSTYFADILEEFPNQRPVIILPRDMKFWIIQSLLEYIYTGQTNVKAHQLEEFSMAGRALEITGFMNSQSSIFANEERRESVEPTQTERPETTCEEIEVEVLEEEELENPIIEGEKTMNPLEDEIEIDDSLAPLDGQQQIEDSPEGVEDPLPPSVENIEPVAKIEVILVKDVTINLTPLSPATIQKYSSERPLGKRRGRKRKIKSDDDFQPKPSTSKSSKRKNRAKLRLQTEEEEEEVQIPETPETPVEEERGESPNLAGFANSDEENEARLLFLRDYLAF